MSESINPTFVPSKRIAAMQASSTLAVIQTIEALSRAGHEVIDLGAGEPDFPTPENIKQAGHRAISENFTRYTPTTGTMELKQAIIDYFIQQTGTHYQPKEVLVSAGGKQTIFNAILSLIDPGDEVLIAAPYWVTFPEIVTFAGGRSVIIDTEVNNFQLTSEMLDTYLTPRSKLLIINSPANPSGCVIPPTEFQRIVQLAIERGLWVISDECYYQFTYTPHQPFSAASLPPELRARTLVAGSFSKTYAMTGWRIGFALGSAAWITEMAKLQGHSTSNPSSIAQKAALEAIQGEQYSVYNMLAEYRRRRDYLIVALNAIPGIKCNEPEGAFYAFPNVKHVLANNAKITTSQALADYLLEKAHVGLTAGSAFGAEGYLRISYATSLTTLKKGIERMAACIRDLV